jgi:hypothetical protein
MAAKIKSVIGGPGVWAFSYGNKTIVWTDGEPQPVMTLRGADGREVCRPVENPAFRVESGPRIARRCADKAKEFFAPLMTESEAT